MARGLTGVLAVLLLAVALFLANLNAVLGILLIAALLLFVALLAFGTEVVGIAMLTLCMALAPLDDVRPGGLDFITFSDLFLGLGFLLLAPTVVARHARIPKDYALGAMVLITASMVASALGPDVTTSVFVMMRLLIAAILLPTLFAWWRPEVRVIDNLARAYVVGQLFSLAIALLSGPEFSHRYKGLSTHVNYFGHTGLLALALCIYLFHRAKPANRWIVMGAAFLCGISIILSGSRAATLVAILLIVLYPVVERSAAKGYLVLLLGGIAVPLGSWALTLTGQNSPISRILGGDDTTAVSDQTRTEKLHESFDRWLADPIIGNGFSNAPLEAHNIYLQVAVVSGVIGLAGFLIIFWSLVRPLFDSDNPLHRLCYAALAYAGIGMLTNSLWDRFTWVVLALGFLATLPYEHAEPPPPEPEPGRRRLMIDPGMRF